MLRMEIRGNNFELYPPLLLEMDFLGCATFVVKDLEVDTMAELCVIASAQDRKSRGYKHYSLGSRSEEPRL